MSKFPLQELEMPKWEKEKWEELKEKVGPHVAMIEAQIKMIGQELRKVEEDYSLDFMCDMQEFLENLIIENL